MAQPATTSWTFRVVRRTLLATAVAASIAFIVSCAEQGEKGEKGETAAQAPAPTPGTHFTNTWRDPMYNQGPLHKLIVVDYTMDPQRTRDGEDRVVASLTRAGTSAVAWYRAAPPNAMPTPDALRSVARDIQADGVVQATLKSDMNEDVPYTGLYRVTNPNEPNQGLQGPMTTSQRVVNYQIMVSNIHGQTLWVTSGQTTDPKSTQDLQMMVGDHLVTSLREAGLIK
jgi:hypothetical protein